MQSETADFAPGAATWRTGQNNVLLDFCQLALICENVTSSTKPEVHNIFHCCQRRTGPRPQRGSMYREFDEILICGL